MIDMVNVEVEYGEGCLWRIGSEMKPSDETFNKTGRCTQTDWEYKPLGRLRCPARTCPLIHHFRAPA